MMKWIGLLLCWCWTSVSLLALDAQIAFASFKNGEQAYIEIYTRIEGASLAFLEIDSLRQASVEVTLFFRQNNQIMLADKFNLLSPNAQVIPDLVDVKRYGLQNGEYDLEVQLIDNNGKEKIVQFSQKINIDFGQKPVELSDLQLLAAVSAAKDKNHPFAKQQYLLEPLVTPFYPSGTDKILFYTELYAPDRDDLLQLKYYLRETQTFTDRELKLAYQKRKAKAVRPLLLALDISDVPSGKYELVLEISDSNQVIQAQKTIAFERRFDQSIPVADIHFDDTLSAEQLRYSLRALSPILPQTQADTLNRVLKLEDLEAKRQFLVDYWRTKSPRFPDVSYEKYMEVVRAVDKTFETGFRFGFETDRGHFYLKYGRPDDIINVQDEPSAPPYEIWSYYQFPATKQNNVRFLFYNPSLAAGDYVLLHSTAIGEINNPQWEVVLYKRNAPNEIEGEDYFSATKMKPNFGRRARKLMEDF